MKTKLIILGCGSSIGVPRIDGFWGKCNKKNKKNFRTRCSAIIVKGNNKILVDASPDIRSQLIKNKINNLSSVILTHEHADQTNGLFELRPFYWINKKKINVYGSRSTIKHLVKRHDYLFKKISDYPPILVQKKIKKSFSLGNLKNKINFRTINLRHGKTYTTAYIFEKTAYLSDCNDLSIVNLPIFKNLNYLIIDCLKINKHPSHFNLEEALFVHNKLNPKKTVLTNLHNDLDYDFLIKKLPKNVIPAFDGLTIGL